MCLVRQNADRICGKLHIALHVGTEDALVCDNEILHLYLESLEIWHQYVLNPKTGHGLSKICR